MEAVNWRSPGYLAQGTERQRSAFNTLCAHRVLEVLASFDPVLVGTIPLGIDTATSDLDIICEVYDPAAFKRSITDAWSHAPGFSIHRNLTRGTRSTIARFALDHWPIEIFGQAVPVEAQFAFRHMVIEERILTQHGPTFRQAVITLKQQGVHTEPAFAQLLGLEGDPYEALLNWGG